MFRKPQVVWDFVVQPITCAKKQVGLNVGRIFAVVVCSFDLWLGELFIDNLENRFLCINIIIVTIIG